MIKAFPRNTNNNFNANKNKNGLNITSGDISRKYNSKNIENGKKFFGERFISFLKLQKQNNKPPDINIKTIQSKVSFSIDKIKLKKKRRKKRTKIFKSFHKQNRQSQFFFQHKKI